MVMLPFIDPRPTVRKPPTFDHAELERLYALPFVFALPIEDDDDVGRVIARARELACTMSGAPRELLLRRTEVLERAEEVFVHATRVLERTRTCLAPEERDRAARYAPILACAGYPGGFPDPVAAHAAAAWLRGLDCATAARAIEVLRRERALLDADDIRCRAYHSLRGLVDVV
jgi:hypothetical protein